MLRPSCPSVTPRIAVLALAHFLSTAKPIPYSYRWAKRLNSSVASGVMWRRGFGFGQRESTRSKLPLDIGGVRQRAAPKAGELTRRNGRTID